MIKTLEIDGHAIHDISSFYDEVNRVFMTDDDWKLGESLDALSDLLYGGYGAIEGDEPIGLVWRAMEKNRGDLGIDCTRRYLRAKLDHPDTFNVRLVEERLAALEAGSGPTYFDMVMEIIAEHPNIELVAA